MGLIILLSLSVSLDTLGIGMSYSMNKIRIPWSTRLVVAGVNIALTFLAVWLGGCLWEFIPGRIPGLLGGGILLVLGVRALKSARRENRAAVYDRDDSHVLEPWEGGVLGFAMALDSVSAGLGLGGLGALAYVFPVLTGLSGVLFLSLGEKMCCNMRKVNGIGGSILILLGLFRIFCR